MRYLQRYGGVFFLCLALWGPVVVVQAASSSGTMVWESKVQEASTSITGPVARDLGLIAFVISAVGMMFGLSIIYALPGMVIGGIFAANAEWFLSWLGFTG